MTFIKTNKAKSCGMINSRIFCGAIPTKVSVKLRANVTAGLQKNVDEVNQ
jgi:hypothetical protein